MKNFMKQHFCNHSCYIEDIQRTGIPTLQEPVNGSYAEWCTWFRDIHTCEGVLKRVQCACHKCGKVLYATHDLEFPNWKRRGL